MPPVPALRKWRQEDFKFKVSFNKVSSNKVWILGCLGLSVISQTRFCILSHSEPVT